MQIFIGLVVVAVVLIIQELLEVMVVQAEVAVLENQVLVVFGVLLLMGMVEVVVLIQVQMDM